MMLTSLKSMFTRSTLSKSLLGATAAAALLFTAPAKSNAQVVIGARIGRPARVVVVARPTPYEIRRREEIRRHEEWVRMHRYHHYSYYR